MTAYKRMECENRLARLKICFSTSQAGFIEQPQVVDFQVRLMGGATLAGLVPSLKAWLVRFARDAIISHYVLPEQWCYRLDPVSNKQSGLHLQALVLGTVDQ